MGYTQSNRSARRPRYGARDDTAAEFAGRVTSIGPEPRFVSGEATAFQALELVVTDVRRGDLQVGSEVAVDVAVIAGMPHMSIGVNGLPALDAGMVMPGVLAVVWANPADDRWQAVEISTDGPSSAVVA
jgi:hypothetical protein